MYAELKSEIINLLSKGTRLDGRAGDEYRKVEIEYGAVENANGSARVTIGDTQVIAGIKMEVMTPYPDAPDVGSLMVNVELYPLSSPEFESGPPTIEAIELARVTDRCIRESKMVDVRKLCITPGEKAWMIVIDICTINDEGNLFDAISLAALAALKDCRLPAFNGTNIDYHTMTDVALPLLKSPVSVTVYKYGDHLVVDPTTEEGRVYDVRLTVGVNEDGTLCSMQKGGDEAVTFDQLFAMIELARTKAAELRSLM